MYSVESRRNPSSAAVTNWHAGKEDEKSSKIKLHTPRTSIWCVLPIFKFSRSSVWNLNTNTSKDWNWVKFREWTSVTENQRLEFRKFRDWNSGPRNSKTQRPKSRGSLSCSTGSCSFPPAYLSRSTSLADSEGSSDRNMAASRSVNQVSGWTESEFAQNYKQKGKILKNFQITVTASWICQ